MGTEEGDPLQDINSVFKGPFSLHHWAEVGFSRSSCAAVSCSHGSVATWAGEDQLWRLLGVVHGKEKWSNGKMSHQSKAKVLPSLSFPGSDP